jgi:hypothetical protein
VAITEARYRKGFLGGMLEEQRSSVLYSDDQGGQNLACNPVFHSIIKGIDVRHTVTFL